MLWARSLRPRIGRLLPARSVLEIAPGYGRWTSYLLEECDRLIGVDITDHCVDVCRERFGGMREARFFVNDGASLSMVADASIDFAFSFDSLVHVEAPQIQSYLEELARTLTPGGAAFLHHSNLGAYADARSGSVPAFVVERHWRATTMSARAFRIASAAAGLRCVSQEIINWIGRDTEVDRHQLPGPHLPLTDCLSVVVREPAGAPVRVYINRRFVDEWRQLIDLATVYASRSGGHQSGNAVRQDLARGSSPPPAGRVTPLRRRLGRLRHRLAGWRFAAREPIARALLRGRCPECGGAVDTASGHGLACGGCRLEFVVR
jgi:SAM-dependent methyltransferase